MRSSAPFKIGPAALGQILVFSIQVGLKALLESWNVVPEVVVGQSIGEITAAYHSGILSLEDAARVIAAFAIFGRKTDGLGGMAVVGLSEEEVQPILKKAAGALCIGGHLGPKTTVLAGDLHFWGTSFRNYAKRISWLCGLASVTPVTVGKWNPVEMRWANI